MRIQMLPLYEICSNESRRFTPPPNNKAWFINTGDVLNNKFLHQDISDWNELPGQAKKAIRKGDILCSEIRPGNGRYAYVEEDYDNAVVSTKFMVIQAKNNVLPRYLYHLITCQETQDKMKLIAESRSGTFPQITFESVSHLEFYVPSLDDQSKIAGVLDAFEKKIELNRRTNETLEAIARALFQSWFVDFDPVRAKAEGRPTGLPDNISALFPDSFEDSELGDIPSGWSIKKLDEVLDIEKGISYKGTYLSESDGLPMINLGCFAGGGGFREEKMKFYSGEYRERHVVKPGDLLIANTDMTQNRVILGSPIVVPRWRGLDRFLFSHHTFSVRFKDDADILSRFVYFSLLQPAFRQIAAGYATGTTVLALPKDGIADYEVAMPSIPILRAFAENVRLIFERAEMVVSQNELLSKLRDALLPKLISGELRVPDAEKLIEEVGL